VLIFIFFNETEDVMIIDKMLERTFFHHATTLCF